MQLHKIVVEGSFGHLYRLHLPYEDPIDSSIDPKDFWDPVSAHTFVWKLQVNNEKWLRILSAAVYPPDRHVNGVELRGAAIKLLVLGILNIYPLPHLRGYVQEANYLLIDAPHGVQYHFIPSSLLVVQELPEVRFFKSEPEPATQFIEQLALTDEQLSDVICDLPLRFGLKSPDRPTRITGLVHAMCNGDVAVVVERPNRVPPRKKGPEELPVEYYIPKLYTLGPHEEPGYEPPPQASKTKLKLKNLQQMDRQFVGEETGVVWGTKVKYLNVDERLHYQVQIKDGKLFDAQGNLFDTASAHSAFGGSGNAIFIMDESGNIYASTVHSVGKFHHSSFCLDNQLQVLVKSLWSKVS